MVWVHLHKDRFPLLRRSKFRPRGAGPYRVIAKINDNAYSIDIPIISVVPLGISRLQTIVLRSMALCASVWSGEYPKG
jgi:hypothetical protein